MNESEDCLYLNVYAPSTPAGGTGRAVIFWIYGGNFAQGTAGRSLYDGSSFAAYEDVIVVTTNYRTNGKSCAIDPPQVPNTSQSLASPALQNSH